jgi:transcriptional regulator with XRE-family HTH domain
LTVRKATEALPNVLLRKARQERGWSQKELADLIEAPQSFMISRWENGTASPGPCYQKKLSSIFGKCYEELGLRKPASPFVSVETQMPIIDPALPTRIPGALPLIGRNQILEQIKQLLCSGEDGRFIAFNGLPGVGKTALAMELSIAPEIQKRFPGGILWAALGPQPDPYTHLRRWGHLLGIKESEVTLLKDCDGWNHALRQSIRTRQMLLVLDDVWNIEDALAYMVGGPYCAYLLTTRIPEVATRFAGKQAIEVPELTFDDSVQLLEQIIPTLVEKEWDVICKLIQVAGALPLTLTLMGNYLLIQMRHRQQRRIQRALSQLQLPEERMRLIQPQGRASRDHRPAAGMPLNIQAVIGRSETLLDETCRHALYSLAVLPTRPATFSEEAVLAVTAESEEVLDRLVDSGLIECKGKDRYQLHQSIADYTRIQNRYDLAEKRLVTYVYNFVKQHCAEEWLLEQERDLILAALKIASQRRFQAEFVQYVYSTISSSHLYRIHPSTLLISTKIASSKEDKPGTDERRDEQEIDISQRLA